MSTNIVRVGIIGMGIGRENGRAIAAFSASSTGASLFVEDLGAQPRGVVVGGYCVARAESVFFSAGGVGWALRGGRAGS